MRNYRKRKQREEVRRILAAMRQELRDFRLQYEDMPQKQQPQSVGEIIGRAKSRPEDD